MHAWSKCYRFQHFAVLLHIFWFLQLVDFRSYTTSFVLDLYRLSVTTTAVVIRCQRVTEDSMSSVYDNTCVQSSQGNANVHFIVQGQEHQL